MAEFSLKSPVNYGWLRSTSFDLTLILGVAALALLSAGICIIKPSWFTMVLLIDLWVLGYHHVVSTFTRLAFDKDSFTQYKFLVLGLPVIVAVCATALSFMIGPWTLATIYLYWQWFHYTRQSYGLMRVYQAKVGVAADIWDQSVIYLLPLAGILYRSYQNPSTFLGLEVKTLPVSYEVYYFVFVLSLIGVVVWVVKQALRLKAGATSLGYFMYMLSHIIIFSIGYLTIESINLGWLVINVWHNAQYILFVWLYNNKRFNNQVDVQHKFLSFISLSKNQWLYYGVCLAISTAVYLVISKATRPMQLTVPAIAMIIYQTINFHHYIVDGIIWKVRKKSLRENLQLSQS